MVANGLLPAFIIFTKSHRFIAPDKPLDRLFNRHVEAELFNDDAYNQAKKQKKQLKFHEVAFSIVEIKKYASKGRPKADELTITTGGHVQKLVVNLNGVLRKIIRHFGKRASAIYLNPAGMII